jgi:hypothetical protein
MSILDTKKAWNLPYPVFKGIAKHPTPQTRKSMPKTWTFTHHYVEFSIKLAIFLKTTSNKANALLIYFYCLNVLILSSIIFYLLAKL